MKSLFIGLLTLSTVTAFAGVLENRNSGEKIQFQLDSANQFLIITSDAGSIGNKIMDLSLINKKKSDINLFAGTSALIDWSSTAHCSGCDGEEIGVVALPLTVAYDVVLLPIKAPVKLIQNMVYNKDFNKLGKAIVSDETVTVSNKRFKRIVKLLK